jgi:hypothetical protein
MPQYSNKDRSNMASLAKLYVGYIWKKISNSLCTLTNETNYIPKFGSFLSFEPTLQYLQI